VVASAVTPYRHRQVGWKLLAGTAVGLALALWLAATLSPSTRAAAPWALAALFGVLALAILMFATLTVEVDEARIRVKFGIGLIRRTVDLSDVAGCELLRIRSWWGWGLHWTPGGWLYNIGGREAVRVMIVRERAVIIGTDDADRLKAAIDARIVARQR
jgi:hypothetical protein